MLLRVAESGKITVIFQWLLCGWVACIDNESLNSSFFSTFKNFEIESEE